MRFIKYIDELTEWSGRIFSWLIVVAALLMLYEVVSRRIFGVPTIWSSELATMFFGAYFILLIAFNHLHDAHIRVDIIFSRLPLRTRLFIDILGFCLFFAIFSFVCFVGGCLYFYSSWVSQEGSGSIFNSLLWPIKLIIPFSFGLLLLQGVADLIKKISILKRTSNEP